MNQDINKNTDYAGKTISEEPLVSIIVITYNSARYVLETLESAKAQTYNNIELIVSDDCSTDNTVEICQTWIKEDKGRFVRTELITSEKNTGISANCNRGVYTARGKWCKLVAGDDVLLPDSISNNVNFIQQNPGVKLLFSQIEFFGDLTGNFREPDGHRMPEFFNKTAKQQFNQLVIKNRVYAPSAFINITLVRNLGGFDERIKNLEDRPFWIKATKAGNRLSYMPVTTVRYRVHTASINFNFSSDKIRNELVQVFYLYQLPNISFRNFLYIWHTFLSLPTLKSHNYRLLKLLSPVWYYLKILMIFKYEES